jgi:hypothetical protein
MQRRKRGKELRERWQAREESTSPVGHVVMLSLSCAIGVCLS